MTQTTPNYQDPEIVHVNGDTVACDGGGGPIGHPRVYLPLYKDGVVECPYCDRRYLSSGTGHH